MYEDSLFFFDEMDIEEAVWCLTQEVLSRMTKKAPKWLIFKNVDNWQIRDWVLCWDLERN